jgi:hypothetical protein
MYACPALSEKRLCLVSMLPSPTCTVVTMIEQLFLLSLRAAMHSIAIICTFAYARSCVRLSRSLSLAGPQLRIRHSHCALSFVVEENCCDFLERSAMRIRFPRFYLALFHLALDPVD